METCPIVISSSTKGINTTNIKKAKTKKAKKAKKSRCALEGCRKKLEVTDWACKCDKKFCQKHRTAPSHSCTYNWKTCHQGFLRKTMLKGKSIDTKNFVNI